MSQLSPILRGGEDGYLMFWCPGCDRAHTVRHGTGLGERWGWNGNALKPTFTPSVLVTYPHWVPPITNENHEQYKENPWEQHQVKDICHSFVVDGRIQFLNDCTHSLAGQTVDLPEWPEETPC
ncbi:DUF6527 family protein [Solimicrobium silvestre]|uniref:Ammonia monooxygenase n=1 Tax=Solimicrobium silvestre TaxID=2099400 RepID=A0A2S9GYB6_9BURK|nr:DUF6527 family protein [Solimicrobium silvestre]PRC92690.1 hypothetical protein S2091_2745 [Solimicrobium silvestre]